MGKLKYWIGVIGMGVFQMQASAGETLIFTDGFEMKIQNDGAPSVLGSDVGGYFLDGGGTTSGDTAHAFDFLRFENLYGDAAGQVPAGATILNASLTMFT